jgi:hypothetical protein
LFATLGGGPASVASEGVKVITGRDRMEAPLPPLFSERYDSIEVRGWWSANDMRGKELEERGG